MREASDESRRKVTVKEFLEREGQKSEGLLGYIAEERRDGAVIYSPIKPESEKGWKKRKNVNVIMYDYIYQLDDKVVCLVDNNNYVLPLIAVL